MKISGEKQVNFLTGVVNFIFWFQKYLTPIKEINNKNLKPCIYAMWHAHECCIFGLKEKGRTNVLISRSVDGEIIANASEKLGFKVVRGSKGKKGSVEATFKLIERLKEGEDIAIMVDGPSGPNRIVKEGVIKIAKMSGAPIVPVVWYSKDFNFLTLPSWDGFTYPLGYTRLINLYGEPIYVSADSTDEQDEEIRLKLQESLTDLEQRIPGVWKDIFKFRLWKRKK